MFEACEAFFWCLKDHFYAIYGHLKNKKKKVQKFQSGIFGLFWTAMASRLSGIDSINILRHPSQKKNQKNIENSNQDRKVFFMPNSTRKIKINDTML